MAGQLRDDPTSLAQSVGFYDAAQVARDVKVKSMSTDEAVVRVTIEGTQQNWNETLTYDSVYLIGFNEDGFVNSVSWRE